MTVPGTPNDAQVETLRNALTEVLQSPPQPAAEAVANLLASYEAALRASRYPDAVLELRSGFLSERGMRYTAFLTNAAATFEQPLFTIFANDPAYVFQAGGDWEERDSVPSLVTAAQEFLTRPSIQGWVTDALMQFRPRSREVA